MVFVACKKRWRRMNAEEAFGDDDVEEGGGNEAPQADSNEAMDEEVCHLAEEALASEDLPASEAAEARRRREELIAKGRSAAQWAWRHRMPVGPSLE